MFSSIIFSEYRSALGIKFTLACCSHPFDLRAILSCRCNFLKGDLHRNRLPCDHGAWESPCSTVCNQENWESQG